MTKAPPAEELTGQSQGGFVRPHFFVEGRSRVRTRLGHAFVAALLAHGHELHPFLDRTRSVYGPAVRHARGGYERERSRRTRHL